MKNLQTYDIVAGATDPVHTYIADPCSEGRDVSGGVCSLHISHPAHTAAASSSAPRCMELPCSALPLFKHIDSQSTFAPGAGARSTIDGEQDGRGGGPRQTRQKCGQKSRGSAARPPARPLARPSVRSSVRPFVRSPVRPFVRSSVRPSVRPSAGSARRTSRAPAGRQGCPCVTWAPLKQAEQAGRPSCPRVWRWPRVTGCM